MSLFVCLFLSAILMNSSAIPVDSLSTYQKTGINYEKQMNQVMRELDAIEGVKVNYITKANIQKGVKVDLNIHFAQGENFLNSVTEVRIKKFSEIINKNPEIEVSIIGHTDNISTLELNQNLSLNRAQTVADFLLAQKVSAIQLKEIAGKNYSEPVTDNSTAAGRAINRRVDVYLKFSTVEKKTTGTAVMSRDIVKAKPVPEEIKKIMQQVIKHPVKSNDVEIEIDGLLIDDTKTKAGKDFYDLFYNEWEAPGDAKNYSITVSEKPFRLTSTLIVISINDDIVYQAILQPRQDLVEAQAEEGIATTQDYLANYEEITKQLNGDDMAGTGIY